MYEIDKNEAKKINLEVLKVIADFCETNNINYILSDGTLLGSIRHNGFIPWDMDIDISMLRSDYERFIKIWKDTKDYAIIHIGNNKNSSLAFAKVVDLHTRCIEGGVKTIKGGVWVDIFPLDAVPLEEPQITDHYTKVCDFYNNYLISYICKRRANILTKYAYKIFYAYRYHNINFLLHSPKYFLNKMIAESTKYNNSGYKNVTNNMVIVRKNEKRKYGFPITCITDYIYGDFENCKFRIPKDYDSLLRSYYGNYMELPPVEKQIDDHNSKFYRI